VQTYDGISRACRDLSLGSKKHFDLKRACLNNFDHQPAGAPRMVEWSRQLVLFVLAAIFSIYWTGKQGLWDAMGGETSWDKEWKEAKQLLVKHIIQG
jgi:hypothetical protein